jgi:hypothetical protein
LNEMSVLRLGQGIHACGNDLTGSDQRTCL